MTLREKFKKIDIKLSENHSTLITDREAEQCEKIADEFAIRFAEWINDNCWNIEADRFLYEEEQYRYKELLEIFKKEKGW